MYWKRNENENCDDGGAEFSIPPLLMVFTYAI
jgi:hypothetical protein